MNFLRAFASVPGEASGAAYRVLKIGSSLSPYPLLSTILLPLNRPSGTPCECHWGSPTDGPTPSWPPFPRVFQVSSGNSGLGEFLGNGQSKSKGISIRARDQRGVLLRKWAQKAHSWSDTIKEGCCWDTADISSVETCSFLIGQPGDKYIKIYEL